MKHDRDVIIKKAEAAIGNLTLEQLATLDYLEIPVILNADGQGYSYAVYFMSKLIDDRKTWVPLDVVAAELL